MTREEHCPLAVSKQIGTNLHFSLQSNLRLQSDQLDSCEVLWPRPARPLKAMWYSALNLLKGESLYKKVVEWLRQNLRPSTILTLEALISEKLFVLPIPYNQNYRRDKRVVKALWADRRPLTVVDVGSRGSPPPELDSVRSVSNYLGFDASIDGQIHSSVDKRDWLTYEILRAFIGESSQEVTFHNFSDGGLSSCFAASEEYDTEFANAYRLTSTEKLTSLSLFDVLGERMLEVDFLKLDTQGSELKILDSRGVTNIPLIEVEVEFIEVYMGQPLFDKIFARMVSEGYRLLWLTRHFGSPHSSSLLGRGSLVFGEALFGLGPTRALDLGKESFERYLLTLSNYGHCDYGEFLLDKRPDFSIPEKAELSKLLTYFSSGSRERPRIGSNGLRKFFEKQRHFAGPKRFRHNSMISDSDRSIFFR